MSGSLESAQQASIQVALEMAWGRQVRWDLPDLDAGTDREVVIGTLIRDRALVQIREELVGEQLQRRRRAPWGSLWARPWWESVVLPAARTRTDAAWWTRRAPREARGWAIVLDPRGAGEAGWR